MPHIFGASSLHRALRCLERSKERTKFVTAISGLHLMASSAKFRRKTVQFQVKLFEKRHKGKPRVILWHDVINNSLTPHSSNFNCPLTCADLVKTLKKLPVTIGALVYCEREGAPKVFEELERHFPTIHIVKHTLSHRKRANPKLLKKYGELHIDSVLDLKNFLLISKHLADLKKITEKTKRLNKRRRKTKNRQLKVIENKDRP